MGRKPCCEKEWVNRGAWTAQEDQILSDYIHSCGEGKWNGLPKRAGLKRCGKSCRLRWLNYLRPDIKRGNITRDEEDLIVRLHKLLGNRWSLIAGRLPRRTDNEIKNYWNTNLSKKLESEQTNSNQNQKKRKITPLEVTRNPPIHRKEQQLKAAPVKTTAFKFAKSFSIQSLPIEVEDRHQEQLMISPSDETSPDYFTDCNMKFGLSHELDQVAGEGGGGDSYGDGFFFRSGVEELKESDFGDDFNFLNELLDSEGGWIGDLCL